jgi:uncharacterized glyoxalase superfamily protein PhnB
MAKASSPIPKGYHSITPHLVVRGAGEAIDFYKRAFGAQELCRMPGPAGKIMHAELKIGDSMMMLVDEFPEMGCLSPQSTGGAGCSLHLYVPDVDSTWEQAVAAGAQVKMPLANQFWGDRFGKITDPFGHEWTLGTHVEDLTPEEMEERQRQAMAQMAAGEACAGAPEAAAATA